MTKACGIGFTVKNDMKPEISVTLRKDGIEIQGIFTKWETIREECTAIDQDIVDMINHRYTGDFLEFKEGV
jgi:hypothetical protein